MPRAKKGLYKVQIFKKTTGPCLSRSYYSMPPCLGCLSISVWVRAWWAGSRWNGKCCGTAGWRWWSRRCSTAGYTTPSRQKGKHLMVIARKYLNFGGKIIKNLAGKVCFNLLSTVEVKQIIRSLFFTEQIHILTLQICCILFICFNLKNWHDPYFWLQIFVNVIVSCQNN